MRSPSMHHIAVHELNWLQFVADEFESEKCQKKRRRVVDIGEVGGDGLCSMRACTQLEIKTYTCEKLSRS